MNPFTILNTDQAYDLRLKDFPCHPQNQREPINVKLTQNNIIDCKEFFLVQFSKNPQNLIQAVLTEKEISIQMNDAAHPSTLLINDGREIRPGSLLFKSGNEDFINAEFERLKQWSFQQGFDEHDHLTIGPNTWILILYTCHTANIVYTIVNNRDTFQGVRNPYADVVCYMNFGGNIYKAIIVRKSENYSDILEALIAIKNSCLELIFPLQHHSHCDGTNMIPPLGFQSHCGTVEEFLQRNDCHSRALLDARLLRLEKQLQQDALKLLEWSNALESIKHQAEEQKHFSEH